MSYIRNHTNNLVKLPTTIKGSSSADNMITKTHRAHDKTKTTKQQTMFTTEHYECMKHVKPIPIKVIFQLHAVNSSTAVRVSSFILENRL